MTAEQRECIQRERIASIEVKLNGGKDSFAEIKSDIKTMLNRQIKIREEIAALKEKSRNWGAIAGAVTGIISSIIVVIISIVLKN